MAFNENFEATVLDLGLGRMTDDDAGMSAYVQTRPWRAPEVAWNTADQMGNYTTKLDMY